MTYYLYPNNWRELSKEIRELNHYCCQVCDRQCRRPGEFWLGWQHELHIAHITQQYDAPVVQLATLCAVCHFQHDAPLVWVARRRAERARQQASGQLVFAFH